MATTRIGLPYEKTLPLENPVVGDEFPLFFTEDPVNITKVIGIIQGGASPSLDFNIRHDPDRQAVSPSEIFSSPVTITSETSGDAFTGALLNGTTLIVAQSWVWIVISAVTIIPDQVDEVAIHVVGPAL